MQERAATRLPALLRELHDLVPSYANEFHFAGPNLELANAYSEAPSFADMMPIYLSRWHEKQERETNLTFTEVMRTPYADPIDNFFRRTLKIEFRDLLKLDAWHLVLRPLHFHKRIQFKVTEAGRGLARCI